MAIEDQSISIVGCGPGSLDYLTPAALRVIEQAEVLVGAKRLLDLFPSNPAERIVVSAEIGDVLDHIAVRADRQRIVVLVTGDPGLFSLAKPIMERFGRARCRVIPGVSSLQTAFARIGVDWADARIISIHKEYPVNYAEIADADKVAVLCGREDSTKWIADHLLIDRPPDRRIFVCQNLTMDDEQVQEVNPADLSTLDAAPSTIVVIIKGKVLL
ncbi:MAG: precorrin-6y C5,15-methyltransferase (decarboxylating) subunit CbiE [Desulfomonilaceae bacterium]